MTMLEGAAKALGKPTVEMPVMIWDGKYIVRAGNI